LFHETYIAKVEAAIFGYQDAISEGHLTADDATNSTAEKDEPVAEPPVDGPRPKFKITATHVLITTPLVIAFVTVIGTILATVIQQHENTVLDRNKFESTLVERALAAPSQPDAARELLFFKEIGLLTGLNEEAIVKEATGKSNVQQLPVFHGAALRDKLISVRQAKAVLSYLTAQNKLKDPNTKDFYDGAINCEFDLDFQIAVMKFQRDRKIDIDGLIGAQTVLYLWEACPVCSTLLKKREPGDCDEH
jgi:hypothetical protein